MTRKQRIELRLSKVRSRLNEIAGLSELTPEIREKPPPWKRNMVTWKSAIGRPSEAKGKKNKPPSGCSLTVRPIRTGPRCGL